MAKLTNAQIIESLKEMTLLEVNSLVKEIESTFGVSAAAPVAVAGPVAEAAAPESVTLILTDVGANKVSIIKLFREVTGLGLMEAKNAVEKAPVNIKENIKPEEAKEIAKKFEEAGAKTKT
ncbi:MAG: 50S ribosomal protein L7/L12, partial [Mycoplasmataceae bacterium]|nr:50S ribosomal protein L7/L12 [Mycoplasmataceae bacterium]